MWNRALQSDKLSLIQAMKQLARDWRSRVNAQKSPATEEACKEYLGLPIWSMTSLIAETTGFPKEDIEYVAWYSDRASECTPRKEPGPFKIPDSDLDGFLEDHLTEGGLQYLRSIYGELEKCDGDGRRAVIFKQLEAAHPGVVGVIIQATRAIGKRRNGKRKPAVGVTLLNKLSSEQDAVIEQGRVKAKLGEANDTSFRPAKEFIDDIHPTYKAISKVLEDNPNIRTQKPSPQRLKIHIGDWREAINNKPTSKIDPQDLPADVGDKLLAAARENENRKVEIDQKKENRK